MFGVGTANQLSLSLMCLQQVAANTHYFIEAISERRLLSDMPERIQMKKLSWLLLCLLSSGLFFWDKQQGLDSFLGYCHPTGHSRQHDLLIHALCPTRGVPKLCWEPANPLRCEHICGGTLVEDGRQPAPALQAVGDQQQPAFHQGSPHCKQALQPQQAVPETAQNSRAEAEVRGTPGTRGSNIYPAAC